MSVVPLRRPSIHQGEPYLDVQPSTVPWLVKGMLPATGVAFLVGASKAGKSFLALDVALRIASGGKVIGRTTRQVGVAYVAAEDASGCRLRVAAWRRQWRRESDTAFDLYSQPVNLLDDDAVTGFLDALEATSYRFDALDCPLGMIVFDTLSRCIPGAAENDSGDMSRAFASLQRIGNETGALTLVLAHYGKAGEERGIRGWSGMDANSDATVTLERNADDTDLRTLTLAKVKNGRDGGQLAFRLIDVPLGIIDDDGEELSSCVPAYENPPTGEKTTRRKAMNPPESIVYTAIRYLTENGRTQPLPANVIAKPWQKALARGDIQMQCWGTGFAYDGEAQNTTTVDLRTWLTEAS